MRTDKAEPVVAGPFCRPLEVVARNGLPAVFTSAVAWLKANALTTEGLFRKKGDGRLTLALKRAYELGRDPIAANQVHCPHTVAGVLRLWLSCLPRQVVPMPLVNLVCNSQMAPCHAAKLDLLRAVLSKAEPYVIELLFSLAEFLHHYRLNHRRSALPAPDMAKIFAPLLLRLPRSASEADVVNAVSATEMLIADYRPIFTKPRVNLASLELEAGPKPPSSPPAQRSSVASYPKSIGDAVAGVGVDLGPSPSSSGGGSVPLSPSKASDRCTADLVVDRQRRIDMGSMMGDGKWFSAMDLPPDSDCELSSVSVSSTDTSDFESDDPELADLVTALLLGTTNDFLAAAPGHGRLECTWDLI